MNVAENKYYFYCVYERSDRERQSQTGAVVDYWLHGPAVWKTQNMTRAGRDVTRKGRVLVKDINYSLRFVQHWSRDDGAF